MQSYNSYTDEKWNELANIARQQTAVSGFHNDNYRLVHDGNALLFRFAREGADIFCPQPFKEEDIYKLLKNSQISMPEFIYSSSKEKFQVHEYIEGALIDEIYPPGQKIPKDHIRQMADFYLKICSLDIDISNTIWKEWPRRGPPLSFFEKLLEKSWITYRDHQETHGKIYEELQIPKDPYSLFLKNAGKLSKRPWRLIHSDIHRANMIEREDGTLVIIDWELALYGDVLYCIASYLHRSRFFPDEKEFIAKEIYKSLPEDFQKNYMKDLSFYLDYEALNSIITDTVRFPNLLKSKKLSNTALYELAVYYADNLNRVSSILGTKTTKPEQTIEWFNRWAI